MNNKYDVNEWVIVVDNDNEVVCRVIDVFKETWSDHERYEYTLLADDDTGRFFYFVPEECMIPFE